LALRVDIKGFKSVARLGLEFGGAAVLIGPPSSGKSNVLEALALYGVAYRAFLVQQGLVEDVVPAFPPLIRCVTCSDLLWRGGHRFLLSSSAEIALGAAGGSSLRRLRVSCQSGSRVRLEAKGLRVEARLAPVLGPFYPSYITSYEDDREALLVGFLRLLLGSLGKEDRFRVTVEGEPEPGALYIPVLYSFDRSGAVYQFLLGLTGVNRGERLLEDASNLGWLLYSEPGLAERVAGVVEAITGIEPRPLADGRIAFFDGVRDVGQSVVSDTVARLVYILAALYSNTGPSYRVGGFELRTVVLIEDVDAHVYPAALGYVADAVAAAAARGVPVIVSTHSGRAASLLYEKAGAGVYYTHRGSGGTVLYRVDVEKMLEEMYDFDDLVNAYSETRLRELREKGVVAPV